MTYRVRRKSKVITTKLSNGDKFKVIRRPFKFPAGGYFWLVAMVASSSRTGNGSEISTTTPTE